MGWGGIIFDNTGNRREDKSSRITCASDEEGYLKAVYEALNWVKELGYKKVVIVGDSYLMEDKYQLLSWRNDDLKDLLEQKKHTFDYCRCRRIKRDENVYAVLLANKGSNYVRPLVSKNNMINSPVLLLLSANNSISFM